MLFFNQVEVDLCGSGCCGTGKNLLHNIHNIRHITFVPYDVCSQQECTHLLQTVPIQAGLLKLAYFFFIACHKS